MNTNCKKWKYLLCITAVMTAFSSIPFNTQAADQQVKLMNDLDKKQQTTSSKMDSAQGRNVFAVTAGAANVLDAEIMSSALPDGAVPRMITPKTNVSSTTTKSDALAAFVKGMMVLQPEMLPQSKLVMAKVNEYVNIRQEADQDAEKVGVLYKDCGGDILEKNNEWTKIKSGDVTGWIKNEYLYFGKEAEELAKDVGVLTAYANTETLRVREEPSLEAGIVGLLADGQAVEAIAEEGDWVRVSYEGTTGFVSSEYVRVEFGIDTAESMEAIREREEAERARAAEAQSRKVQQKEAVLASATELEILAALIQCEAGGEPYEGQVAVGAVVINRVLSSVYPNSLSGVIYQNRQFEPVSTGRLALALAENRATARCYQAADEAMSGVTNVGHCVYFRTPIPGLEGIRIGGHVFY